MKAATTVIVSGAGTTDGQDYDALFGSTDPAVPDYVDGDGESHFMIRLADIVRPDGSGGLILGGNITTLNPINNAQIQNIANFCGSLDEFATLPDYTVTFSTILDGDSLVTAINKLDIAIAGVGAGISQDLSKAAVFVGSVDTPLGDFNDTPESKTNFFVSDGQPICHPTLDSLISDLDQGLRTLELRYGEESLGDFTSGLGLEFDQLRSALDMFVPGNGLAGSLFVSGVPDVSSQLDVDLAAQSGLTFATGKLLVDPSVPIIVNLTTGKLELDIDAAKLDVIGGKLTIKAGGLVLDDLGDVTIFGVPPDLSILSVHGTPR